MPPFEQLPHTELVEQVLPEFDFPSKKEEKNMINFSAKICQRGFCKKNMYNIVKYSVVYDNRPSFWKLLWNFNFTKKKFFFS